MKQFSLEAKSNWSVRNKQLAESYESYRKLPKLCEINC